MATDRDDFVAALKEAVQSMRGPEPHVVAAEKKLAEKHKAKRDVLEKTTKQNATHRFYRVTQPSFVTGYGLVQPGRIVEIPKGPIVDDKGEPVLDALGNEQFVRPSHTWQAVKTQKEINAAVAKEAEEEAAANEAAEDLQDDDDPETEAVGGRKAGAVGGRKAGAKRAADKDVA